MVKVCAEIVDAPPRDEFGVASPDDELEAPVTMAYEADIILGGTFGSNAFDDQVPPDTLPYGDDAMFDEDRMPDSAGPPGHDADSGAMRSESTER